MTAAEPPEVDRLLRKVQPEALRRNLVRAGLFLAGWEMLKGEVVERVRGFFLTGFDEKGLIYSEAYARCVLSKHQSVFEASILWLVETGALTEAQATQVRDLRVFRNEVAHELPQLLLQPGRDIDADRIHQMKDLIGALGRFWGRNELDVNPEFDATEVRDTAITSGVMLLMDLLVDAAEGSDTGSRPEG